MEFCCPNSYTYYAIGSNGDEAPDPAVGDGTIVVTSEQRQDASTWNLPPVGTSKLILYEFLSMVIIVGKQSSDFRIPRQTTEYGQYQAEAIPAS